MPNDANGRREVTYSAKNKKSIVTNNILVNDFFHYLSQSIILVTKKEPVAPGSFF